MNYRKKWYQQISLFKFVKRFVKEGGYKRGSKKRKKKKRPIRGWYPMAAASWMRIASRGGVSYRRIISATEARRAFSSIFAAVPSPSLFISRVYFLQRTDPFVYPPSPRCSDNDGFPPAFDLPPFSSRMLVFSSRVSMAPDSTVRLFPRWKIINPMEQERIGIVSRIKFINRLSVIFFSVLFPTYFYLFFWTGID